MTKPKSKSEARDSIIQRAKTIVRQCNEGIRDIELWNGLPHNQDERPIDCEYLRVTKAEAVKVLAQFGEDDYGC